MTLEQAFEELKKRLKARYDWEPPEHINTVDKFVKSILTAVEDESMFSSQSSLMHLFTSILNERD